MAWTESYHCDVCNTPRNDAGDWWLAWSEEVSPGSGEAKQPMLRLTPWTPVLSQSVEVKHLCGARCAQTMMDRWMGAAARPDAPVATTSND
jgi:hypothetical protein